MDATTAILDGGRLDYSHDQNGTISPNSEEMDHLHHSLSTLPEVNSVGSDQARDHVNGSAVYDPHVIEDDEEDYADEIEITDCDPPYNKYGYIAPDRTMDPRILSRTPRSRTHRDVYERRPPQYGFNTSTYVNSKVPEPSRSHRKTRQKGTGLWGQETLSLLPNVAYDYWTLPRSKDLFRRSFDHGENRYQTPSGMLQSRKSHGHRSSKRSHKTRISKLEKFTGLNGEDQENIGEQVGGSTETKQDENDKAKADDPAHRSELKVYFRFSKGITADSGIVDYSQNEPLLEALQAHCRGWLARQNFEKLLDKHDAVRIIQRNAERIFNPWIRLMLALRPLLKSHRLEEELLYLRSELERYKTLVKMLRFENAEYQAKVANLLHLIEQINTKGMESSGVNSLVLQISEALAKNQEFWQEMAATNKALQASTIQKPTYVEGDGSPLLGKAAPSPMTQLRQDADFYRNQVEMLKEEADEQQHRSSEHFQGQVSVLSDRVEHLQSLLALESSKVERLSNELEEMNNTIVEAKSYERNLEHMVSQLSKQLEQRTKAKEQPISEKSSSATPEVTTETDLEPGEQCDLEKQLNSYRELVGHLRAHLSANPKAMTLLANTPFQPGGQLDLFNEPPPTGQNFTLVTPISGPKFFANASQVDQMERSISGDMTPGVTNLKKLDDLKRQISATEKELHETNEQMKREIEDRETLESENMQLHNRIAAMDRQLRRTQDEFDEAMTRRDLAHQRKLKELSDQLEEEIRKTSRLTTQNRDLEMQLTELRNVAEPDEDIFNDQWESMRAKLRADVNHYKQSYDLLQEEFEQFRAKNDPVVIQEQMNEKEERIALLEREKQQWRIELEVLQVKLQNSTNLLEETENRLKMATRERAAQMHRVAQLENERDEAIREAANITGRASAERETASSKLRELEEVRVQRDALNRELTELKQVLAGHTAENAAEKRQLQARLRELEVHNEARISDFKAELERTREELERLQVDLQTSQTAEREQKALNQQYKWKIDELEDQLSHSNRRITGLERRNTDMEAELVRAKADLSASREAASLRRAARVRMADEWLQAADYEDPTDDDEKNNSISTGRYHELGHESPSEDSPATPRLMRTNGTKSRSSLRDLQFSKANSLCRSNPSIFRDNLPSMSEQANLLRGSVNTLDRIDDRSGGRDQTRLRSKVPTGLPRSAVYTKSDAKQFETEQQEVCISSPIPEKDVAEEKES
ncbi:Myosin-2 [Fasciola hepatica]|uniref:Myosin-2 n=1 Tax=Fasciola hepatica TaxID=6192 RepID=A0A4E0RYS0_FASHE|nr:Myosin-2 [Fasciola hepatica]